MKLLFDRNLSHKLALIFGKEFPDSTHVREVGLASSPEAFLIIDPSLETLLEQDSQKAKSIRVPVESAAIVSIGYDRQSRTLEVEFKTGVVYQYFEVPETVYKELLSAPSKGAYMNSKIKLRYRFQMVL